MNTRFNQGLFVLLMAACVSSSPGQTGTGAPAGGEEKVVANAGAETASADAQQADQEQLRKLLAPIALYPDVLLAQVLPACTYPLEVVQAARWLKDNPGEAKKPEAIEKLKFDPSIKAVMQFPDTLALMDKHIDATSKLGEYFLADGELVLSTIQDLRKTAKDAGSLKDTSQQQIVEKNNSIVIESPDPQIVYVPQYNPQTVYVPQPQSTVVYGSGGYSSYSSYPDTVYVNGYSGYGAATAGLIGFSTGVALGAWGSNNIDWDDGDINIDWDGDRPNWWGGGNDVDIDVGDINVNRNEFNNQINKLDASQRTNVQNNFNKLSKNEQNNMLNGFNKLPEDKRAGALNDVANLDKRPGVGGTNSGTKKPWKHDATRPGALPGNGVYNRPGSGGANNSRPGSPSTVGRPSTLPAEVGNRLSTGGRPSTLPASVSNRLDTGTRPSGGASTNRMSSSDIQSKLSSNKSSRPAASTGASQNFASAANRNDSSARPSISASRPSSSASRPNKSALSGYGSGSEARSSSSRGSSSRSSSAKSRPSSSGSSRPSAASRPSGGSRPNAGNRSAGGGRVHSGGGRR